jgi:hypothetical protein
VYAVWTLALEKSKRVQKTSSSSCVRFVASRPSLISLGVLPLRSGIMNDFYNVEYMSERVAALAKERDELRREVYRLNDLCERQARLNLVNAKLTLELDTVKAERDALKARLNGKR